MKQKKQSNLSGLMSYAGGHKILVYLSWVLSGISAVLALFPFVYIFFIIREVVRVSPDFSGAVGITHNGWMAVLFALLSILVYLASLMCSHISAFRIAGNMRIALLEKLSVLPLGRIEEIGSGKVRRTITDATAASETYLAHRLPDLVSSFVTPAGIVVLLFVFDWRFGIATLIPTILAFVSMSGMAGKNMQEDMKNYQEALMDMNNVAVEYVRGIPVVKAFGQTIHSFTRFKESIERYFKFCMAYTVKCRRPMMIFTVALNSAFFFIAELTLILTAGKPVGETVLLSALFYIIFTPIVATVMNRILFVQEDNMLITDSLGRVHDLLDIKPLPESAAPGTPRDSRVEFSHVSFRYSEGPSDAVHDLSFTAKPGQKIALVGPSGGGKTTAASLISRFFDPTEGTVKIGDTDVRNIPSDLLTDTVSFVFQDSRLLKMSILENVRMGKPSATKEEVLSALHLAQCDDILEKLPEGENTVIGSKGTYLSGGEQQRVAIARMILKDAPVIVLDEATAFADPENEALVQKSFEELSRGKTLIMIAHRLTTVQNADQIIVLENGKAVENGTHDELLKQDGLYKRMWDEYQTSINWKVGAAV